VLQINLARLREKRMIKMAAVESEEKEREPFGRSQVDVKRRLSQLFSTPGGTACDEQQVDALVSELARGFLHSQRTGGDLSVGQLLNLFKESQIPGEPSDVADYLNYLGENVIRHSTQTASPRFIGHMTTALPYFVRPFGKLMTALNQNVVKAETSKSFTPYERQALAMIHRLIYNFPDTFYDHHIQNPASTLGLVVSGGTLANVTALWCARNAAFGPAEGFAGVEVEGLPATLQFYGYKGAVIIGSSILHYSIDKAADLLGIGTRGLVKVATDGRGRIDLRALRRVIAECHAQHKYIIALVGVAGATDCGAIDPLPEMAEIAREAGAYFHVDAAWGGSVLFSESHKHKLAGIEMADSVTIDGHKQLYLPMGIGMVALRDPHLARVIEKRARYIIRPGSIDLGKRSPEGSRPAMALFLHGALSIIGLKGYEILIDEGIRKAQYLVDRINARPEFELLMKPEINIVNYRFIPNNLRRPGWQLSPSDNQAINEFNVRLQKAQRRLGNSFVSRTVLDRTRHGDSIVALRAVIANPVTSEADLDAVLDDQVEIAAKLA
jgi:glutamate decarboxylase